MTDQASAQLSSPLIEVLEEAAKRKGLNKQQLAESLGVTYGYLAQLKSAIRDPKNISDAFAEGCAAFLGIPRIKVLLLAGRVRPSDFYEIGSEEEFRLNVWKALDFIKADTEWGVVFPYELLASNADPAVQQFVVLLYEKATGKVLLGDKVAALELLMKGEQPKDISHSLLVKRESSVTGTRKASNN